METNGNGPPVGGLEVHKITSRAPENASFGVLLGWHLSLGTRPGERIGAPGRRWIFKRFAFELGLTSDKTVRNWLGDRNIPANLEAVERVLFGDITENSEYEKARAEFRNAYERTRRKLRGRPELEVEHEPPADPSAIFIDQETKSNIAELLALARSGGAFDRARDEGISELAVRNIVIRLGGVGVSPGDLVAWLDQWIASAQRQLGQQKKEDFAFEAARQESERQFKAGSEDPTAALMEELRRSERVASDHQEEHRRRSIRILEEAIRFDEISLKPEAAVLKLRLLAKLQGRAMDVTPFPNHATEGHVQGGQPDEDKSFLRALAWLEKRSTEYGEFLEERAAECLERGEKTQSNAALLMAITIYRVALEEWTRERVPFDWARLQNNLGNALHGLGEREADTRRLKEAVAAYRAALEERTRERVPADWAATQNNLGNALRDLGRRETDSALLEKAVSACRAALEERTRERDPVAWAITQNNLGNALLFLGQRKLDIALLQEAVAAYRAALEERTRERAPLAWALIQTNLGDALEAAAVIQSESYTPQLEEAVAAYRAALEEQNRTQVPLAWARTQTSLGNALLSFDRRKPDIALLHEAVAAFRAALEEQNREHDPLSWARTQHNLGDALHALGQRRRDTSQLKEAVAAYRAALEEQNRKHIPLIWAGTQYSLGITLRAVGETETGTEWLEESVAAYRAALEELTSERVPFIWPTIQAGLEKTIAQLEDRRSRRL